MATLRVITDIDYGGNLTNESATKYAEQIKDYAAVVLAPGLTEKMPEGDKLRPNSDYHIHTGSDNCRSCRAAAQDGRD